MVIANVRSFLQVGGPHPSVHRHSHAGSRRRPTLRGHGSIPLPATLGLAASLEKTNACRWRANDLLGHESPLNTLKI